MSREVYGDCRVFSGERVYLDDREWIVVFNGVYKPAEDTWLLLEIIDRERVYGRTVLDLCSGSGVVGLYMLKYMGVERVIMVDIDYRASCNEKYNVYQHSLMDRVVIVNSSLSHSIRAKSIDVVVANPPYLPGYEDYVDVVGGPTGLEVIRELLSDARRVLRDNGLLYMVFSSLAGLDNVYRLFRDNGFKINKSISKHYFFEDIVAVEAVKEF